LQRGKGLVKVKIRERERDIRTDRLRDREGHTCIQTERDTHRDRYRNGEL
jgi:hypothetical protein